MDPNDPFAGYSTASGGGYGGNSGAAPPPYGETPYDPEPYAALKIDEGRPRRSRKHEATSSSPVSSGPPMWALYVAAILVVVALIALAFDGLAFSIAGYLLATAGCISLVCLFRVLDVSVRSSHDDYVSRPDAPWLASGVLILGTLAALPHVWAIAQEFG